MVEVRNWARMFPGHVDEIARVRAFVRNLLEDHPAVHDAELIVSELATNAIQHSRSKSNGGLFVVRVHDHGDRVRIAVTDYGSDEPWPRAVPTNAHPLAEHGRGLVLVDHIAKEWGSHPEPVGTCVWADIATPCEL